jgi:four helix bundle protein
VALSRHRDLVAYRLAVEIANECERRVRTLPSFAHWTVGIQLVRAADSVGANVAEGFARRSKADRRRFLIMARASVSEVEHWLDLATARRLFNGAELEPRVDELGRTIAGLIRAHDP